jgi:hypothetical protein
MAAAPAKTKAATDSGWTAADWAAAFAAVAAFASLVAVLQNRRMMSAALQPHLTGVVLPATAADPVLQFHNAGGAVALTVRALWAHDGRRAEGDVSPGIRPGGVAVTLAPLSRRDLGHSNGVVVYRDAHASAYARSLDGQGKVWRNRWWTRKLDVPGLDELFEQFYGYSVRDWTAVELRYAHRQADLLIVEGRREDQPPEPAAQETPPEPQ